MVGITDGRSSPIDETTARSSVTKALVLQKLSKLEIETAIADTSIPAQSDRSRNPRREIFDLCRSAIDELAVDVVIGAHFEHLKDQIAAERNRILEIVALILYDERRANCSDDVTRVLMRLKARISGRTDGRFRPEYRDGERPVRLNRRSVPKDRSPMGTDELRAKKDLAIDRNWVREAEKRGLGREEIRVELAQRRLAREARRRRAELAAAIRRHDKEKPT